MKKFLLKIGFSLLWFACLFLLAYLFLHGKFKRTNALDGNNYIFVWGDSQMYQGLDIALLGNKIEREVLTSAGHGKGIYDFLVCEKIIPDGSTCVVSFPECAFFRNPLSDNNRTGLDLSCLKDIINSGCPLGEAERIIGLNRKIQNIDYKAFNSEEHNLYKYADSLVYPEPLPAWHPLFEEKKDWFQWKAKSYEKGIHSLFEKRSQIILIQFPFDEQVESFAKESVNRHLSDSLKTKIVKDYSMKVDTLELRSDSLLMHDLSHMNVVGARLLTKKIAEILSVDTVNNRFLRVVIE